MGAGLLNFVLIPGPVDCMHMFKVRQSCGEFEVMWYSIWDTTKPKWLVFVYKMGDHHINGHLLPRLHLCTAIRLFELQVRMLSE